MPKRSAAIAAPSRRPRSFIEASYQRFGARELRGYCDRERAAELDEERLKREIRLEVELLEEAPERTDALGRELGGRQALEARVLRELLDAVGVHGDVGRTRGHSDQVAEPGGELLEREQQLLPLGAASGTLELLVDLARGQVEPLEARLQLGFRLVRALARTREDRARRGGRVELGIEVDGAGGVEQCRPAGGSLRVEQALDAVEPAGGQAGDRALLGGARAVYLDPEFDAAAAASTVLAGARERANEAKAELETRLEGLDLPAREVEAGSSSVLARGAEREQLLLALERTCAAWFCDLIAVAAGALSVHADSIEELTQDASLERGHSPRARGQGAVPLRSGASSRRLSPGKSRRFEALFIELRRALAVTVTA